MNLILVFGGTTEIPHAKSLVAYTHEDEKQVHTLFFLCVVQMLELGCMKSNFDPLFDLSASILYVYIGRKK